MGTFASCWGPPGNVGFCRRNNKDNNAGCGQLLDISLPFALGFLFGHRAHLAEADKGGTRRPIRDFIGQNHDRPFQELKGKERHPSHYDERSHHPKGRTIMLYLRLPSVNPSCPAWQPAG